jgi:hypothetical protein
MKESISLGNGKLPNSSIYKYRMEQKIYPEANKRLHPTLLKGIR